MNRAWSKLALCALVVVTIYDVMAYGGRRVRTDRTSKKEALSTWEDEGGALPTGPSIGGASM
jgi:hypothetical protein